MSIRKSIILTLFFCLAAAAAGVSLAARAYAERETNDAFRRNASAQLDRVEDIIHTYLRAGQAAARTLAAWPETREAALAAGTPDPGDAAARTALARRLSALRDAVPGLEAAFCGFRDGTYVSTAADVPDGYDPRAMSWYSDTAWGPADVAVTDAYISETSHSLVATMGARIKNDKGETLGVAAVDMGLGPLTDTLRDIRFSSTGYLLLLDARDRVLLDPVAQENLMRPASETGDEALLALARNPDGAFTLSRLGTEYAAFSRVLAETRWKAVLLAPLASQPSSARDVAWTVMLTSAAFALLFTGIGALLAHAVTRPLHALIAQSGELAEGNAEALAGIPGRGPDITTLHGNLGRLTGRIMLLVQAEKEKTEAVEEQSRLALAAEARIGEADKAAREAHVTAYRHSADVLTPLSSNLAAAVTSLAGQVEDVAQNMTATITVAEAAHALAADMAQDAASLAGQGAETERTADAVLLSSRNVEILSQELSRSLEVSRNLAMVLLPGLENLKNTAGDMGITAAAIRELGERANMLGLNLSIEGAGAAEHSEVLGRAADDVRAFSGQAMTLAETMDAALSLFEQGHTAHALTAGKSAAAVKRVLALTPALTTAAAETALKATAAAEQVRVLSTALSGAKDLAGTGEKSAAAAPETARAVDPLLRGVEESVQNLTTLSANLAAIAEDMEAEADVVILSKASQVP